MNGYSGYREQDVGPPVRVKPDLVIPQWYDAVVQLDTVPNAQISLRADWNFARFEYEIISLTIKAQDGISSEDLHRLSRPDMLKASAFQLAQYADDSGDLVPLRFTRELIERLREKGFSDETLLWMSRMYAQQRAEGQAANKIIVQNFQIPPRTANYWISRARALGLLD